MQAKEVLAHKYVKSSSKQDLFQIMKCHLISFLKFNALY